MLAELGGVLTIAARWRHSRRTLLETNVLAGERGQYRRGLDHLQAAEFVYETGLFPDPEYASGAPYGEPLPAWE